MLDSLYTSRSETGARDTGQIRRQNSQPCSFYHLTLFRIVQTGRLAARIMLQAIAGPSRPSPPFIRPYNLYSAVVRATSTTTPWRCARCNSSQAFRRPAAARPRPAPAAGDTKRAIAGLEAEMRCISPAERSRAFAPGRTAGTARSRSPRDASTAGSEWPTTVRRHPTRGIRGTRGGDQDQEYVAQRGGGEMGTPRVRQAGTPLVRPGSFGSRARQGASDRDGPRDGTDAAGRVSTRLGDGTRGEYGPFAAALPSKDIPVGRKRVSSRF